MLSDPWRFGHLEAEAATRNVEYENVGCDAVRIDQDCGTP
jgi:hypothetical protein